MKIKYIGTMSLVSAFFLIAPTYAVNAQEGVYYTTDKGSAGVVKAEPPPVYLRDPSLPNYYDTIQKDALPPSLLTYREIDAPRYWQRQQSDVLGKDSNGMMLHDRGEYCSNQVSKINRYAEISMKWLNDHDLWFAPSVGFIPHGVVMSESRDILTYAQVAFRDIRYAKNDGARIQHCDDIADFAINRMQKLLEKYPEDPRWIERGRN